MLFLKVSNEGFMENQHSKSINKPKFELQLHLALQQDILSESAFYTKKKDSYANCFSGFLALTNTWALVTRKKLQNPPKITLRGNCHSSAAIIATHVHKVSNLDN